MIKKLLIGLAAFFGLIVLLLAGAISVPFFISGDVYRAQVTSLIENATGREFRIDGPIKFDLLPDLALSAADVSFANATGGVATQMARLKSLEIKIRLRPLLSGRIEITGFVLDQPEIALEVDKKGRPNWRLGEAEAPAAQPGPEAAQSAHGIGDLIELLDRFHLTGFVIRNGSASFYDARDGEQWHADGIDVKFAMAGLDSPLTADGEATWNGQRVAFDYAVARPGAFAGGSPSGIELHISSNPVDFDFSGDGVGEPERKLSGNVTWSFPPCALSPNGPAYPLTNRAPAWDGFRSRVRSKSPATLTVSAGPRSIWTRSRVRAESSTTMRARGLMCAAAWRSKTSTSIPISGQTKRRHPMLRHRARLRQQAKIGATRR